MRGVRTGTAGLEEGESDSCVCIFEWSLHTDHMYIVHVDLHVKLVHVQCICCMNMYMYMYSIIPYMYMYMYMASSAMWALVWSERCQLPTHYSTYKESL